MRIKYNEGDLEKLVTRYSIDGHTKKEAITLLYY